MAHLIKITDVSAGMVLAEPVLNNMGHILLPAGIALKENHIKLLRSWNIYQLYIKDNNNDEKKEMDISPELLNYAKEKIAKLVRWLPSNKIESELLDVAAYQYALSILKNTSEEQ